MNAVEQIDRRIRAALGNIRLAFRGVITLVKAAGAVQLVQMDALAGEQLQDNELFQHYGFTSNPLPGTMAIVLPIGGRTAHGIIVATEHGTYRLKNLAPGEVALHDDLGQKVHLTRTGIVIHTTQKCRVEAADIECHASHSYSWDVNGFGERWTWTGGTAWEHKTWQTGAAVTNVPLPINPPEGP